MLTGEKFLIVLLRKNKLVLGGGGLGLKNWLPGMVLKDLRMRGKIDLFDTGGKKSKIHIEVIDDSPTGNSILDEYLQVIKEFKGKKGIDTKSIKDWVVYFRDKYKKRAYTQKVMWQNLEDQGIIKNQGRKHVILKPEIRNQLYEDIKLVAMNKKVPDEELKALVSLIKRGHGWRHYLKRSERDKAYCKEVTQDQIIVETVFWDIVVEKRKAVAAGVTAGTGAVSAAGSNVLAASNYGVNTLSHGMRHTEASRRYDASVGTNVNLSRGVRSAQSSRVRLRSKKEEEE